MEIKLNAVAATILAGLLSTSVLAAPTPAPTLKTPANNPSPLPNGKVSYTWTFDKSVSSQRIVVSQNQGFTGFRDANGTSSCDTSCSTRATSDSSDRITVAGNTASFTQTVTSPGQTYWWKVRVNGAGGATWSETRSFTIAGGASSRLSFPFSNGQTWYVCQGYNGSISHKGNLAKSLDLSVSSNSTAGGKGCSPNTASSSQGQSVIAPDNGTVAWIGSSDKDIMCLSLDGGGSMKLGHFYSQVSQGSRITRNSTVLGNLTAPGVGTNGGYSHIHMQLFSDKSCGTSVDFGTAFGTNLSSNGSSNQWYGTALKK